MTFATLQNNRPAFFMEACHLPDIVKLKHRRLGQIICFFAEPVTELTIELEDQMCEECLAALKQRLLDFFAEGDEQFAKFQPSGRNFLRLHVLDEDRLVIAEEFEAIANVVKKSMADCHNGHHKTTTSA